MPGMVIWQVSIFSSSIGSVEEGEAHPVKEKEKNVASNRTVNRFFAWAIVFIYLFSPNNRWIVAIILIILYNKCYCYKQRKKKVDCQCN